MRKKVVPFRASAPPMLLAVAIAAAGCLGHIGDEQHGSGAPGSKSGGDDGDTTPAAASPLGHLTSTQYANTLRDLFAPMVVPEQTLPADIEVEGFTNNAATQTPSAVLIEALHTSAVAVATAAMKDPGALLGCTPATRAAEDACAADFLAAFGPKANRRPLAEDDLAALLELYMGARADGTTDFATAMTLAIEAILQSPGFVYRVEIGTPLEGRPDRVELDAYEMASRLSYFLWNTMPDDELFAAAESGELGSKEGVEKHARRLLGDARAHDAVLGFHREWLRFGKMSKLQKDPTLFPDFGPEMATAMTQSAEMFVDGVFFGDGSLATLLTDDHAWVNDLLAPIYGVASPGAALSLVPVDATQRSGILTNAGMMAGFAHETSDSPVLRGVWVLDRLMCQAPPPPPKNVDTTPPAADPGKPQTTRERFATQHEQGSCAACHHRIDGIGFGFEHYDAVGAWRTEEVGLPVDSSGWFSEGSDLTGTFDGAIDLGQKLAASRSVQVCVASQWLKFALGVDHKGLSAKSVEEITDGFVEHGLDMRELVVALATGDAFRTRVVEPQE